MKNKPLPETIPTDFSELQKYIDDLAVKYLDAHKDFVDVAIKKDAALKEVYTETNDHKVVKELLATYPFVAAIAAHEVAHELELAKRYADARRLAEVAHSRTGIDIHPRTIIGENCFMDHGTGVVIGATATVGKDTLIYHNVTLGAFGNPEEGDPKKLAHRHPEIGSNCTLSLGVHVLGHVVVGNGVQIGPDAKLRGNKIEIGNSVLIGSSVEINDNNKIADKVLIGAGVKILKGTGTIDQNIPAYSYVSRDKETGKLVITPYDRKKTSHTTNYINGLVKYTDSIDCAQL